MPGFSATHRCQARDVLCIPKRDAVHRVAVIIVYELGFGCKLYGELFGTGTKSGNVGGQCGLLVANLA